jgi:spore germination protein GerM
MDTKRIILIGTLVALLVILTIIFFQSGGEKIKPLSSMETLDSKGVTDMPAETKKVTLFFISDKDEFLHKEEREILAGSSLVGQIRQILQELVKGSQNGYLAPMPPETRLRELYITSDGILYLDFSRDIQDRHLSGASAEIETIYSIVNSIAYNFKSVKKIFFLIEGDEKETLGGHVDLSRPFLPKYDLISR